MSPALAKPSATIVVLREGSSGPEVLLVKRRAGDAFGDSYAFPGGVVDDDECASHVFSGGVTPQEANALLGVAQGGLDYFSAAIRELFEETGILLARDSRGDWVGDRTELDELRIKIDRGQLAWCDFLRDQELHMSCDSLHYFAHWETPFSLPKRWSTRFFLAELPPGQDATHDGSEVTDSRWMNAANALTLGREGSMILPIPTLSTLKSLSDFESIAEILDWAKDKASRGVERILPETVTSDGKSKYAIPGDAAT